jgi:hypothetical protein
VSGAGSRRNPQAWRAVAGWGAGAFERGRLYIGDANGQIYEVIEGVHDAYKTVIVPGNTIVLRFVASFDHDRTTIYRVNGVTTN